jgi:hypothetical protein
MAIYAKVLESRIFDNKEEAQDWSVKKKMEYKEAGNPVKADIVPADATRRRWKVVLYLKA